MSAKFQFDGIIGYVSYWANLTDKLTEYEFSKFDVNTAKSLGIINLFGQKITYSKWDSPSQIEHYPFAKIYRMYNATTKITIIPIMKDGGADGELEYLQFSILSWMNLAGVYIILAFYDRADKNKQGKQKIINQQFNSDIVNFQIAELANYKSSPMCWNRNLFGDHFKKIYKKAIRAYEKISINTNVKTHLRSIKLEHLEKIRRDFRRYEGISIEGAKKRYVNKDRELHENKLVESTKSVFYLIDKVGGIYYLTANEVLNIQGRVVVQETRQTNKNFLPPIYQIQDALFRLSLFQNIDTLYYNGHQVNFQSCLKIKGNKMLGNLFLPCNDKVFLSFIRKNKKNFLGDEFDILFKLREETERNPNLIVEIGEN